MQKIPGKDSAPIAGAAIVTPLVPAAAHPRLDDCVDGFGLPDLIVVERPPSPDLLGEDLPGYDLWRFSSQLFPYAVRVSRARNRLLRHRHLYLFHFLILSTLRMLPALVH